jgi:hypothetical protein
MNFVKIDAVKAILYVSAQYMNFFRASHIYCTTWLKIGMRNTHCLAFASFVKICVGKAGRFLHTCNLKQCYTFHVKNPLLMALCDVTEYTICHLAMFNDARHSTSRRFCLIVDCHWHVLSNHGEFGNPWTSKHVPDSGGGLVNSVKTGISWYGSRV